VLQVKVDVVADGKTAVNDKLERMRKEAVMQYLKLLLQYLHGRKAIKNLSQCNLCLG
jgi:hypothetical protein